MVVVQSIFLQLWFSILWTNISNFVEEHFNFFEADFLPHSVPLDFIFFQINAVQQEVVKVEEQGIVDFLLELLASHIVTNDYIQKCHVYFVDLFVKIFVSFKIVILVFRDVDVLENFDQLFDVWEFVLFVALDQFVDFHLSQLNYFLILVKEKVKVVGYEKFQKIS